VARQRVESYIVESGAREVRLTLAQGARGVALALVCLAVVVVSWWFGPDGPRNDTQWARLGSFYWIWTGFFCLVFVLALVMACYRETWIVTPRQVEVTRSLGPWRRTRRLSNDPAAVRLRVQTIPAAGEEGPSQRLTFLDADGKDHGLRIGVRYQRSLDRLVEALRESLSLDVQGQGKTDPVRRARRSA
jgi:hypothetical protein